MRTKVAIIPDSIEWILGAWSLDFKRILGADFDFCIVPFGEISDDLELVKSIFCQCDVVHVLSPWCFEAVRDIVKSCSAPPELLISTINHISDFDQVAHCLAADRVMTICRKYRDVLIASRCDPAKIFLMHSGVDPQEFFPRDRNQSRKKLSLPVDAKIIGFAGKASSDYEGRKGIDRFINLLHCLEGLSDREIVLVTVGPGWKDRFYEEQFTNIKIRNLGFIEKESLPIFYSALDLYVSTSRVEGGPVPVLEAMSSGVAVATTSVGLVPEFIINGENGVILDFENDIESIGRLIISFINRNTKLIEIGLAGRETVLKQLDIRLTCRSLFDLYRIDKKKKLVEPGLLNFDILTDLLVAKDRLRWKSEMQHDQPDLEIKFPKKVEMRITMYARKIYRCFRSALKY